MNKSLEAYNILLKAWQGNKEDKDQPDFDDINEALDTIKQDLERLEQLEKENEILNKALDIAKVDYTTARINLDNASARIKDLEKALDKACEMLNWDCPVSQDVIDDLDCENRCSSDFDETCKECWKMYFLNLADVEVLENENQN